MENGKVPNSRTQASSQSYNFFINSGMGHYARLHAFPFFEKS
jgi:hypothetical protein